MRSTKYNNLLNQLVEEVAVQKHRTLWGPMEEYSILRSEILQTNFMDKVSWILKVAKQIDTLNVMVCRDGEALERQRLQIRNATYIMRYSFEDNMNGKMLATFSIRHQNEDDSYSLILSSGEWGINRFPDKMTPIMIIDGNGDLSFRLYNRFNQPKENSYERELNEMKVMNQMMKLFIVNFDRYHHRCIKRIGNNIDLYRIGDVIYQEQVEKQIQNSSFPYGYKQDKENKKTVGKDHCRDER